MSAAPMWSSSPARWPTFTRDTRRTRCASGMSGRARSPASGTGWTLRGSVAGSWATPCSATAPVAGAGRVYQHVCENRQEVGVRGGRPGALAEQLAVPATSLHALPDSVDSVLGALVEPGGNAFRAAQAAALAPGDRALVLGPGTIGLLAAMFARAAGAEVHLMGRSEESLAYARSLGFEHVWTEDNLPSQPFDAVIDASNAAHLPALALDLVEPAGRVVYIGLAGSQSHIDTRTLVLKDVTAVGVLSASPGLDATITAYASGVVDPRPLVAATVSLEQVSAVLAGERPEAAGPGPKIHVDPLLS